MNDKRNWLYGTGFFILGATADFLFVGVFKIVWIAIYATTYFALAMTLESYVYRRFKKRQLARLSVVTFLLGAFCFHLLAVGQKQIDQFSMQVISKSPLVLKTSEFPEFLYVTSEKLSRLVEQQPQDKNITVKTVTTTDYGCLKKFFIESADEINLQSDPSSAWTLRTTMLGVFSNRDVPSIAEHQWPWCRVKFYRD